MYQAFYNFSKKPFKLNADIEFFYESAEHKRAKLYLNYGLSQGEGFVIVTGAPGMGKTLLIKELCENLKLKNNVVFGLIVSSQLGAHDILRVLAETFAIQYEDNKAALLNKLQRFFREKAKEGKRVVLFVDEAQNLPKESLEELRMLLNFEIEPNVFFQVFLIGQEELGRRLYAEDMKQVKQRVTATYHLKALTEEESTNYIIYRLTKADWHDNPQITSAAFEAIYQFTRGVPRLINTFCDRLLLYGFLEELTVIDLKDAQKVFKDFVEESTANAPKKTAIANKKGNSSSEEYPDLNKRIESLEHKLDELMQVVGKEKALLRKAILIQLDIEEMPEIHKE
ncbi:MAG: AAA family ATPase [Methylococcaceae bacterium]|nr:AAA family ATPase [Methylococcaceae bacterium]